MKTLSDLVDSIAVADKRVLNAAGLGEYKDKGEVWKLRSLEDLTEYTKSIFKEFEKPEITKNMVKLTKISRVADMSTAILRSRSLSKITRRESILTRLTQAKAYEADDGYYAKLKNVDKVLEV